MIKQLMTVLTLSVMTLGFVACGPGPSGDGDAAGDASFTIKTTDDFVFDPADVTVASGSEVSITIDNSEGALEHSWVVLNADQTEESALEILPDGDDDKKYFNLRADAGETNSGSFTAPAAGTYVIVCEVAGHAAGGMLGTLTVE